MLGGASCNTICALVPPMPSEVTPAHLGRLPMGQSISCSHTFRPVVWGAA